eukprot:g29183.t1
MAGASIASGILTNLERKIAGPHLLLASILPYPLEVSGAIGFSFLLICILLVDVGKLLDRCRPDDFMAVLVAMNSTLMVVVSIPFFVLTFCFLHSGEAMDRATTEPSVNAESVVPPINEMTAVSRPHAASFCFRYSASAEWPSSVARQRERQDLHKSDELTEVVFGEDVTGPNSLRSPRTVIFSCISASTRWLSEEQSMARDAVLAS